MVIALATHNGNNNSETISVELGTVGGEMRKYILPRGATVSEALEKASFPSDSEVRINGEVFSGSDELSDGDSGIVLAQEKVKGGKV